MYHLAHSLNSSDSQAFLGLKHIVNPVNSSYTVIPYIV